MALNAAGQINSQTLAYRYGGSRLDRKWRRTSQTRWRSSWLRSVYTNRNANWWYRWYYNYYNRRGVKFYDTVTRWNHRDYRRSWAGTRTAQNNLSGNTLSIRAGSFGLNGVNLTSRSDISLAATAGSLNIGGIGQIKAGRDLNVWARDSLNLAGGVTFGRNLALTASRGSIDLNTRISAPGNVSLYAYKSITNRNSLRAGGDFYARSYRSGITNYGSISAGRDLTLDAYGAIRNIALVSGSLSAGRDALLRSRTGSVRSIRLHI